MATHKFDKTEFDSRRQARTDLLQPHAPPSSLPGLRNRVDLIETMVGIVLSTPKQN